MGRRRVNNTCRPLPGKTFLTIGQDLFSIEEYVIGQWNASLHRSLDSGPQIKTAENLSSFTPAAVMVYTDIQTLRGLSQPADYGSGVEFADGLLDGLFGHQSVGLQIGLWLNGTVGCQDILSGKLNANLRRIFDYIAKCHADVVFLRVGYEFDNPSFGYSDDPKTYRLAFSRVVEYCRENYVWCQPGNTPSKVQFVWHSWAAARLAPLEDFYPDDDVVDWVGISIFQQLYPESPVNVAYLKEVLEFARQHDDKPVMIAESTPFGAISQPLDAISSETPQMIQLVPENWQRWFQPTLDLIEEYDISMWCYINCAWESQPMWKGVGFGDTRLSSSKEVMEKWNTYVLENPRFLMAGSMFNCRTDNGKSLRDTMVAVVDESSTVTSKISMTTFWSLLLASLCGLSISIFVTAKAKRRHSQLHRTRDDQISSKSYGSINTCQPMQNNSFR